MISGPDEFASRFNVSRETLDRLEIYGSLLRQWQNTINLIAPKTLEDVWHRHFSDSAQLFNHIPSNASRLLDLGSGAGFPGLVLAILAAEKASSGPDKATALLKVTLVESDTRKAAFLREVARELSIAVDIVSSRIESIAKSANLMPVDVVTSRALAPLPRLLELMFPFASPQTVGLLLKGKAVGQEISEAQYAWMFEHVLVPSVTDAQGRIVEIRNLQLKKELIP